MSTPFRGGWCYALSNMKDEGCMIYLVELYNISSRMFDR